ncbi:hypothetical protein K438DRAFT_997467 [Mycena galopus ATCC 62051]|nr:hypothetical protein K438DRAFT_997467 [Mycena galopus ATCC 62051]
MRDTFAHLRDCCRPHPALKEYRQDLHTLDDVLERFKKLQKYLVHAANDMEKKGLMQDLQSRRKRVDMLIERYDFIRTVLDMDTSIVSHPPQLVNGRYLYRWHCGKTGGPEGGHSAQTGPFHDPSFGQCHEVFGFRWTSPKTSGRTILGLPRPPQDITFSTSVGNHPPSPQVKARAWSLRRNALRATATIRLPLGRPAGVGTELRNLPNETEKSNVMERAHGQTASGGVESNRGVTFDYYMPNQKPVYILGWTISCYWPKRDPRPSINVDHHSKHILSDRLAVSVDNAYPAQWHCTVYFVKQSEYNFSDLLAPRNKSPPSMRKPNWVQRLFGN